MSLRTELYHALRRTFPNVPLSLIDKLAARMAQGLTFSEALRSLRWRYKRKENLIVRKTTKKPAKSKARSKARSKSKPNVDLKGATIVGIDTERKLTLLHLLSGERVWVKGTTPTEEPWQLGYKFTHADMTTYKGCKWKVGVAKTTDGKIPGLCNPSWLHRYTHPKLAVAYNPDHGNYRANQGARMWEVKCEGKHLNTHDKVGDTKQTLLREIPVPVLTPEVVSRWTHYAMTEANRVYAEQHPSATYKLYPRASTYSDGDIAYASSYLARIARSLPSIDMLALLEKAEAEEAAAKEADEARIAEKARQEAVTNNPVLDTPTPPPPQYMPAPKAVIKTRKAKAKSKRSPKPPTKRSKK